MRICTIALLALLVVPAVHVLPAAAQSTTDPPLLIEELECRGNQHTSCAYILSYLYLSAGSEVDEEEIRNARFRLSALPNFTSVRIFLEKGSARGKAKLIVEVAEADPLFSEALAGVANQRAHVLGLRIGHQNLFGSGERLELTASAMIPAGGPVERELEQLRLEYIDPTLFGSQRYFFTAGVGHFRNRFTTEFGDELDTHETGIDFMVGRRLWDFSYLAIGYRYLTTGRFDSRVVRLDGFTEITLNEYSNAYLLDYGWNSEDDPYFPTRGGRLRLSVVLPYTDARFSNNEPEDIPGPPVRTANDLLGRFELGYRHTWTFATRNYLHLRFGATPGTESSGALDDDSGFTLGYERALPANAMWSGIERGRWYIQFKNFQWGLEDGHSINESGMRVGVRLDTRQYGIVELYLQATKD
jgi:outer membrane translocation and assembly module TamA